MRKTLFALAATTLVSSVFAAELRVGLNPAYEPFESKTPSGDIVGFDVEAPAVVIDPPEGLLDIYLSDSSEKNQEL